MCETLAIAAIGLSVSMPTTRSPPSELSLQEREELYYRTPPVIDERDADAEADNAYEIFNLRPRKPTNRPTL
ncbi:hypothetical protein KR018_012488 [Drosophila ironensis]|nr:hypothetical protein KR018_012488 [Drosophila ironensis]